MDSLVTDDGTDGLNTPLNRLEKLAEQLDLELFLRSAESIDKEDNVPAHLLDSAVFMDEDVFSTPSVAGHVHNPSTMQLGEELVPQGTGVSRFLNSLQKAAITTSGEGDIFSADLLRRNFEEEDDLSSDYDSDSETDEALLSQRAEARRNDVSLFTNPKGGRTTQAALESHYASFEVMGIFDKTVDAVAEFAVRPDVSAGKLQGALVEALVSLDTQDVDIRNLGPTHFLVVCDGVMQIDVQICVSVSMRQRVIVCAFASLYSAQENEGAGNGPHVAGAGAGDGGNGISRPRDELTAKRTQFVEHLWACLRRMTLARSALEHVSEEDACAMQDSPTHGPSIFGLCPILVSQMQSLILREAQEKASTRPEKELAHVVLWELLRTMYHEHGLDTARGPDHDYDEKEGRKEGMQGKGGRCVGEGDDNYDVNKEEEEEEEEESGTARNIQKEKEVFGTALTKTLVQVDRLADLLRMRCEADLLRRASTILTDLAASNEAQSSALSMGFLAKFRNVSCGQGSVVGGGAGKVSAMRFEDTLPLYYCSCIQAGTYPCTLYITPRLICLHFPASGSKQALQVVDLCHVSEKKGVLTLTFEHFVDIVELVLTPIVASAPQLRTLLEHVKTSFPSPVSSFAVPPRV
jgi:hypothetical protein